MKLIEFKTYEDYINAQKRADRRKTSRIGFNRKEMGIIIDHVDSVPRAIMCHGARNGAEVDEFKKVVGSNARVVGTDLFLKGHQFVTKWDFSKQKHEWIGAFDLVYSNALDHARDPVVCLQVWLEQLSKDGSLAIQWNTSHRNAKGGDCFGASLNEYVDLLNGVGNVTDILYVDRTRKGFGCVILVKKK